MAEDQSREIVPSSPGNGIEHNLDGKEAKFVEGIIQGKTKTQAAIDAGYGQTSYGAARTAGYDVSRRPHVKDALQKAFDKAGLSVNVFAQKIKEGIDSTKIYLLGTKAGVEKFEEPDFFARLKYLQLIADVRGWKAPERVEEVRTLRIELDAVEARDRLMALAQDFQALSQPLTSADIGQPEKQ